MTTPKFPDAVISFDFYGTTGNAFYILGATSKALRKVGATDEQVKKYNEEAMSGDYDNLVATTRDWVSCITVGDEDD